MLHLALGIKIPLSQKQLTIFADVLLHAMIEIIDGLRTHLRAHVPIEGGGHPALLHVSQNVAATVKGASTLLGEQACDKVGAEVEEKQKGYHSSLDNITRGNILVGLLRVTQQCLKTVS